MAALSAMTLLSGFAGTRAVAQQAPKFDMLRDVRLEQLLDQQVPLDIPFRDENGKDVKLGDYFGSKPVILVMPFYQCKGSCTLELNGMVKAFSTLPFTPGNEFNVVTVSINPKEGPDLAKGKHDEYVGLLRKPDASAGWHFLTGQEDSIKRLAAAVGFHYIYDVKTDQYSHPAGIMIVTPKGKLSRYFLGAKYPEKELRLSLIEASENRIGTLTDQIVLACTNYDPRSGSRSFKIMRILQASGILTAVCMAGFLIIMFRREKDTDVLPPKMGGQGSPTGV